MALLSNAALLERFQLAAKVSLPLTVVADELLLLKTHFTSNARSQNDLSTTTTMDLGVGIDTYEQDRIVNEELARREVVLNILTAVGSFRFSADQVKWLYLLIAS